MNKLLAENNILFKGVDPVNCRRMISCFNAEVKRFREGSCILDNSHQVEKIGIILEGSASIVRFDINGVRTIIEKLGEQGIFGDYFTFSSSCRGSIVIEAETECDVMFIRRSEILKRCENACQCHSAVVENLLELMTEKSRTLNERIEVLSQRSIEDKLITYLQIVEDNTADGEVPQIPFSTTALSDYLCVNRSALQREISRLKAKGVLTVSKRNFRLNLRSEE